MLLDAFISRGWDYGAFSGHHVTSDGHILVAAAGQYYDDPYGYGPFGGTLEFELGATKPIWEYARERAASDVQRLDNGHTLVNYWGEFVELDGNTVVATMQASMQALTFEHRLSLYGPPPN